MGGVKLKPIGVVHSPYKERKEAPRQGDKKISEIEIYGIFQKGLEDIDGFSHLHVIYWLHESGRGPLLVTTPWDTDPHGVFATRSPNRPNPIGHSIVELLGRSGRILRVRGLDAIEGTPVIDLKPYIPGIDSKAKARVGWFKDINKE